MTDVALQQTLLNSWQDEQKIMNEMRANYLKVAQPIQHCQRSDGQIIFTYHENLAMAKTLLVSQQDNPDLNLDLDLDSD